MDQSSTVVLSINVGASSLTAVVRDPVLRMRVHVEDVTGDRGRVLVSIPGKPDRRIALRGGWPQALHHVAAAMDRHGLRPRVVAHRIAGGGNLLTEPRWADDGLLTRLRAEAHIDPLCLPRQLDGVAAARRMWPLADDVLCPDETGRRTLPAENTAPPLVVGACPGGVRGSTFHSPGVWRVVEMVPQRGAAAVEGGGSRHTASFVSAAVGILVDTPRFIEGMEAGSPQIRRPLGTRLPPPQPGISDLPGRAPEQPVASAVSVPAMTVDAEAVIDQSVRALTPDGTFARAMALAGETNELTFLDRRCSGATTSSSGSVRRPADLACATATRSLRPENPGSAATAFTMVGQVRSVGAECVSSTVVSRRHRVRD
ncbi:MAG: Acetate kinase [Modestobacter sp.]|nr:Acetate kinase [Modestobacter sp.]